MTKEFHTPVAIVTGGSGYLGSAIVRRLVEHNWEVIVLSRNPLLVQGVTAIPCDLTNEQSIQNALKKILSSHDSIDALIHAAAAPLERTSIDAVSPESRETTIAIAVTGFSFLAHAIIPYLNANASIVGITTQLLDTSSATDRTGAYIPAKQTLRELLKDLSVELQSENIRVYAVAPGFLPGGLNNDLPKAAQAFFAKESGVADPTNAVAGIIEDICVHPLLFPSGVSVSSPTRNTKAF